MQDSGCRMQDTGYWMPDSGLMQPTKPANWQTGSTGSTPQSGTSHLIVE